MRLRNKNTGEIFELDKLPKWLKETIQLTATFYSRECEVYEPKEPLIKDKEIRKAVIAWAKANSQQTRVVYKQLDETISLMSFIDFGGLVIEFNKPIDGLTSGKIYKFTELCGEEARKNAETKI